MVWPLAISYLIHHHDPDRSLRSSDQGLLAVPFTNLRTKGDLSFEYVAPSLWNTLSLDLRAAASVDSFSEATQATSVQVGFCDLSPRPMMKSGGVLMFPALSHVVSHARAPLQCFSFIRSLARLCIGSIFSSCLSGLI